ncbi:MAG: hypothetical protein EOO20_12150 [Chryseobacterium sp.]|nr:MAG: hypothetical protein EOO20_12150 [Chryseobacterium sp.]
MRYELHNVLSGKSEVRFGKIIQTISCYLKNCERASGTSEGSKYHRSEETKSLELFISKNDLWIKELDTSLYISEGAEQKVYLDGNENVFKLNDAIYYSFWVEYFYSLLLHNYFFADTAYDLIGFVKENDILYAVVQQSFVTITKNTDLIKVKQFLASNGFENNRNNDYYSPELGIILEDLHDENVLTKDDMLYFIDTVFFLTEEFWKI